MGAGATVRQAVEASMSCCGGCGWRHPCGNDGAGLAPDTAAWSTRRGSKLPSCDAAYRLRLGRGSPRQVDGPSTASAH